MHLKNLFLLGTLLIAGVVGPFQANADVSNVSDLDKRGDFRDYEPSRQFGRKGGDGSSSKRDLSNLNKRQRGYSPYPEFGRKGREGSSSKRDLSNLNKRQRGYSPYPEFGRKGGDGSSSKRDLRDYSPYHK